jgi:outer membrane protein OmpA-like peptidoglycan-associated protein
MIKLFTKRSFVALLCAVVAQAAWGQPLVPLEKNWYVGAMGGTSFGQGTFRSITEHQVHCGLQGGMYGGYRFNRLLSIESGFQFGGQNQYALDCCPYWMSDREQRYMSPVLGENGWYYQDLKTSTRWGKIYLQLNTDLISLFTGPEMRWWLNVAPQISAVTTKTSLIAPDKTIPHDRQWHLGLGGQADFGYQITRSLGASLYAGITCMTGERFDNIPVHAHKSNLIYDAGVKVRYSFRIPHKIPADDYIPTGPAVTDNGQGQEDEAARLAAEEEARRQAEEAARLAAEQAERERLEREAAEAAARAAAQKEAAFNTPIPTVYFGFDSSDIDNAYVPQLEMALAILQQYPDFQLEIHAYASKDGNARYNRQLSERRMEAIRQWFEEHGIGKDRMGKAYFHGVDYDAPILKEARRAELKFAK